jgi:hypothetical protein
MRQRAEIIFQPEKKMRYALFVALALCSCAVVKPIPTQSLNCLETSAPGAATQAALCVAKGGDAATIESCFAGVGESAGVAVLECEGIAIWGDIQHAQQVAVVSGVPAPTVQANAVKYLTAKGVIVVVPTASK